MVKNRQFASIVSPELGKRGADMRQKDLLSRLLRTLSGKTQKDFAHDLGVHPSLIGHFERGRVAPAREDLERLAAGAGITLAQAEEILRLYEVFRRSPSYSRTGSPGATLDDLTQALRAVAETIYRRVLRLPRPGEPSPADRERAEELWTRMEPLPEVARSALVRVAREFQSWALCEKVCAEAMAEAPRDAREALALGRLALDIAERVPGPDGWRDRVMGYAMAHLADILRTAGDMEGAMVAFATARRLWHAGSDPAAVLDPGRLPDQEATAEPGRSPARA